MLRRIKQQIFMLIILIFTIFLLSRGEGIFGFEPCQKGQSSSQIWASYGSIWKNKPPPKYLPLIYIITPTIFRHEQKADLTRLSYTLRLVPRIHWIVVEDRNTKSKYVANFLKESAINYTHLACETNLTDYWGLMAEGKIPKTEKTPKGDQQRNCALEWITKYGEFPSVFYFADDDNSYDIRLFEEMRFTKKVSIWPVGLISRSRFQTPVVKRGKVVGFASGWIGGRKFPVDMAAFAVNSKILKRPNPPRFATNIKEGLAETKFLEQINVTIGELEPRADNCTKVLVWHTRTGKSSMNGTNELESLLKKHNQTTLEI